MSVCSSFDLNFKKHPWLITWTKINYDALPGARLNKPSRTSPTASTYKQDFGAFFSLVVCHCSISRTAYIFLDDIRCFGLCNGYLTTPFAPTAVCTWIYSIYLTLSLEYTNFLLRRMLSMALYKLSITTCDTCCTPSGQAHAIKQKPRRQFEIQELHDHCKLPPVAVRSAMLLGHFPLKCFRKTV